MRLEFLPAYSPNFNPIKQAFSAIKAYVRRNFRHFAMSATTLSNRNDLLEVYEMLLEAVYSITPEKARSFFHQSGYL